MLPTGNHWLITNMWSQDQGKTIAKAIALSIATGISDESYKKNNRGTAACILEKNTNIDSRIYVVYDTPGGKSDQSPYRSELGGISMMFVILKCIVQCYSIKQGSIQLGLDEKGNGTGGMYLPTLYYSTIILYVGGNQSKDTTITYFSDIILVGGSSN